MLCGCIDIGTNTTRVLVADAREGRLTEVLQRRSFTRLGRGLAPGGAIPAARIAENAGVVAEQVALAEQAGAQAIRAVATAVHPRAANRDEFCRAMREHGGVEVSVLDGEEEARLAFLGATNTLAAPARRARGGGRRRRRLDRDRDRDGRRRRRVVAFVRVRLRLPRRRLPGRRPAVAGPARRGPLPRRRRCSPASRRRRSTSRWRSVAARPRCGGSWATSSATQSLERALRVLTRGPAVDVAARFELDPQRVRLMPAGLLALEAPAHALGQTAADRARRPARGRIARPGWACNNSFTILHRGLR